MKPLYANFEEFTEKANPEVIGRWLLNKSRKANAPRRNSTVKIQVSPEQILDIMFAAKGRCIYCDSLCVEKAPVTKEGKLARWSSVGRRIGTLEHLQERQYRGDNNLENLAWCCYFCNSYPPGRILGAKNHGGIQND